MLEVAAQARSAGVGVVNRVRSRSTDLKGRYCIAAQFGQWPCYQEFDAVSLTLRAVLLTAVAGL